jgi:hypothetical protein
MQNLEKKNLPHRCAILDLMLNKLILQKAEP